jgi:DNA mismatch repair protein MutS
VDRHRELKESARGVLKSYLEEERARSGIANLKLKYNRIIGWFLEVTRSNAGRVPEHFIRRQTLVGGERYSTARLGDLESEINNASERIVELERERFLEVRRAVQGEVGLLLDLAELFSDLDVLQAFAFAATVHGYVRPEVTEQRGSDPGWPPPGGGGDPGRRPSCPTACACSATAPPSSCSPARTWPANPPT